MPHIPRTLSPTSFDYNALPKAPKTSKPKAQVPYKPSTSLNSLSPTVSKGNSLISKLSMKEWDFNPLQVYKILMQKEAKSDEYSGLVS